MGGLFSWQGTKRMLLTSAFHVALNSFYKVACSRFLRSFSPRLASLILTFRPPAEHWENGSFSEVEN